MHKFRFLFTQFSHRIIMATLILLFALVYLYDVESLKDPQDKLLVNPVIWIIILLYPIILFQEWREFKHKNNRKQSKEHSSEYEEDEDSDTSAKLTKKVFFFMISTFAYLILMNYFGFLIVTVLYLPLLMWILGTKSKTILILVPIITTAALFILFDLVLEIPLPQGLFLEGMI